MGVSFLTPGAGGTATKCWSAGAESHGQRLYETHAATSAGVRELPWAIAGGFVVPFAIVGDAVRESWQQTAPQEEGRAGAVSEQPPHDGTIP